MPGKPRVETAAEAKHLLSLGESEEQIARMLGVGLGGIAKACRQVGDNASAQRFERRLKFIQAWGKGRVA